MRSRHTDRSTAPARSLLVVACAGASLVVEAAPAVCAVAVEALGNDGRAIGITLLAVAVLSTSANAARQRLAGRLGYLLLSGDWVAVDATGDHRSRRLRMEDLLGRAGPALVDAAVVVGYLAIIAVQRPLFAIVAASATCLGHGVTTRIACAETTAPAVDLWSLRAGPDDGDSGIQVTSEGTEWQALWGRRAHWLRRLLRARMWSDVVSETLAYGVAAAGVLPILETPGLRSIAQGILTLKLADGLLHFVGTGVPARQYLSWVREARFLDGSNIKREHRD